MEQSKGQTQRFLATVSKALDILQLFADARHDLSLTDIAGLTKLPKSSVFRYLATLEWRAYLQRDPDTERYHLGPTIIRLGATATRRLGVRQVAEPLMRELRDTYRETVNLAVPASNGRVVYVGVVESNQALKMAARLGDEDSIHSSALGKAMLATMSETQLEQFKARPLARRTDYTITDWPSLIRGLDQVRKRGFAIDDRESDRQVRCVGAAILDHQARVVAAISISGPASRFTLEQALELGPRVRAAARSISTQLGYQPNGQEVA